MNAEPVVGDVGDSFDPFDMFGAGADSPAGAGADARGGAGCAARGGEADGGGAGECDGATRGFPAFPKGGRRPGRFARTWWGNAWIKAMQDTSLDQEPLKQGRRYAYAGVVGPITVSPGRIAAPVHDDADTYRAVVFVERLANAEWERLLDQVAAKAGHLAALLDRDMPHDLVQAAEDAGVRLLPGIADLEPECDCPDWELPCKHAAALCFQASWLLDEDPFVLLLLRGRGERELLTELQRRNVRTVRDAGAAGPGGAGGSGSAGGAGSAAAAGGGTCGGRAAGGGTGDGSGAPSGAGASGNGDRYPGVGPGSGGGAGLIPDGGAVAAAEAYAAQVPGLPEPPPPPPSWNSVALLDVAQAPGLGPDVLRLLVMDAAVRARELLAVEGGQWPPVLDEWQDTVRWAALYRDTGAAERLRKRSGLARAVEAWRYGGVDGLDALESVWSPPRRDLARARAALAAGWEGGDLPELDLWRNRWTVSARGRQLRYGRDGRWYPYEQRSGEWWPAGPADRDPAAVFADLLL